MNPRDVLIGGLIVEEETKEAKRERRRRQFGQAEQDRNAGLCVELEDRTFRPLVVRQEKKGIKPEERRGRIVCAMLKTKPRAGKLLVDGRSCPWHMGRKKRSPILRCIKGRASHEKD